MKALLVIAVMTFAALVDGCAPNPESIVPVYTSSYEFNSWSCSMLVQEVDHLQAALAPAIRQQRAAATGDTIGFWLLGLPVASMSGHNHEEKIAVMQGRKDAVSTAFKEKRCST